MTRMAEKPLTIIITSVAVAVVAALATACGGSSGSATPGKSSTLNVSSTPFKMNGASAVIGNVSVARDSTTNVSTITFDVSIANNTDATDAFTVSVNVEESDNTTTGIDTLVVSDLLDAGQTTTGHGRILFPGPFPSNPTLAVTNIDAQSSSIPGP